MTDAVDVDRAGSGAVAILRAGARALARSDDPETALTPLLEAIAEASAAASAVIMTRAPIGGRLTIAASVGLADGVEMFDVAPTAPGGPALRSHLPLVVTRHGTDRVVGVLALAHDRPIAPALGPVLESAAELGAVALDR